MKISPARRSFLYKSCRSFEEYVLDIIGTFAGSSILFYKTAEPTIFPDLKLVFTLTRRRFLGKINVCDFNTGQKYMTLRADDWVRWDPPTHPGVERIRNLLEVAHGCQDILPNPKAIGNALTDALDRCNFELEMNQNFLIKPRDCVKYREVYFCCLNGVTLQQRRRCRFWKYVSFGDEGNAYIPDRWLEIIREASRYWI